MLNDIQRKKAVEVWKSYSKGIKNFINASMEFTQEELDKKRLEIIPEIQAHISKYLTSNISLDVFKTELDGLNKRNRLWGFKGINGQMYFNMLYNTCTGYGLVDKLEAVLLQVLPVPNDITEAKSKITLLTDFSNSLVTYVTDRRQAPRTGSSNFFISYFWQIQDHANWPIFYKSMTEVFEDIGIWSASGDYPNDYESFYNLLLELKDIYKDNSKSELTLWDIEHAFWVWGGNVPEVKEGGEKADLKEVLNTDKSRSLPTSYVPPVVSIVPLLAVNSPDIVEMCKNSGISVEKAFEDKTSILLKMLGYSVESLGQGYGRVPDGIAVSSEFHYAIIFDTKSRKDGYSLGTDDRAFREYIFHETEKLKRRGIRNVYFCVISSFFKGDYDDVIRSMKMETDVREIIFMEASALITILEQKLRNSDLDLGPKGIQAILAQSGTITNSSVKEFLGV